MRNAFLFLLVALFAAAPAMAAESDVLAAEKGWAAAVVAQDFAKLDKVLNDELIYAHSTGIIETKGEYLAKLKSGKQRYTAIEHEKTTVKLHGDMAIVHSIAIMKGTNASGPFDNKLMMIHTWVKHGGMWQLAAHQTTELKR